MTHYDTDIIAYNRVIIVTGFADEAGEVTKLAAGQAAVTVD
jgi:hypothetical protein